MNRADRDRQDSRYVDPNRRHVFVPNDLTTGCYRCDQRQRADIHDGPWLRRELSPGFNL